MKLLPRVCAVASTLMLSGWAPSPAGAQEPAAQRVEPARRWYKGNTHTHTLNSDGDSTPDDVVRWYREHGYHFLVLTDHNFLTSVEALQALHGADDRFLVVRGEEVTDKFGDQSVHVNGLNLGERVPPQGGSSVLDVVQRNVDAVRKAGGIPHVNHPNFRWSISTEELQLVRNNRLLEIFNGHPMVNNVGGGGVPGLEQVWDAILSSGALLYGIAVDDAHIFKDPGNPAVAGPGRGWVVVRATRLEPGALMDALERGDFYASTGVELSEVETTTDRIRVDVRPTSYSKYRIQFIGRKGQVLQESLEPSATYTFRGDEGYVRARVLESNGHMAWVQPVVVARLRPGYGAARLRPGYGAAGGWESSVILALGFGMVGTLVHVRRRAVANSKPRDTRTH
ncbi:MAG TPA: CehA/McbA family metallohydrolase [Vicinamibacterales bacterium]|nr:CehA/McbA family metallohydrolase [Vicinamibacterales bacterium]